MKCNPGPVYANLQQSLPDFLSVPVKFGLPLVQQTKILRDSVQECDVMMAVPKPTATPSPVGLMRFGYGILACKKLIHPDSTSDCPGTPGSGRATPRGRACGAAMRTTGHSRHRFPPSRARRLRRELRLQVHPPREEGLPFEP